MELEAMEKPPHKIKEGKRPHELFVLNLIFFHLLVVPAGLAFGFGYWGMLIPLVSSSTLLLYYRAKIKDIDSNHGGSWVQHHWQQALSRFRWLYAGYGVVAILVGIVRLFIDADSIAFVALTRVAVMPAIILVLVTFVMSTSAIGRAENSEE